MFPSYPFPLVPAELAGADVIEDHSAAWQQLQAGDLVAAERLSFHDGDLIWRPAADRSGTLSL